MSWYRFEPYVPVAQRRIQAVAHAAKLAMKEGRAMSPIVKIARRDIATSFWGKAWCQHLEKFSDLASRLPRGRTYARNGSIVDLQISKGEVRAIVAGSHVYTVTLEMKTLLAKQWSQIKSDCTRSVASLIDLLQGRFEDAVMARLTDRDTGLFPKRNEIEMACSCPDHALMCKHIAAVFYGIGARLDRSPELLFTLRDVDHLELVNQAVDAGTLEQSLGGGEAGSLAGADLGEIFGIEMDATPTAPATPAAPAPASGKKRGRKAQSMSPAPSAVRAIRKSVKKAPSSSKKKTAPAAKKRATRTSSAATPGASRPE